MRLFWVTPINLIFWCSDSSQDAPDLWAQQQRVHGRPHGQRAPEDLLQHQAPDRAGEEGVPLQQVPEPGQPGGGGRGPAQLSSARRRWKFGFRADRRDDGESGCTRTHSGPLPRFLDRVISRRLPVCAGFKPASPCCFFQPQEAKRQEHRGNFNFQIGSNQFVVQAGGTGLNIKIQVIPSRFCKRTNKILLIVHKDWADCLFILNFFPPWIYLFLVGDKFVFLNPVYVTFLIMLVLGNMFRKLSSSLNVLCYKKKAIRMTLNHDEIIFKKRLKIFSALPSSLKRTNLLIILIYIWRVFLCVNVC